MSVTVISGGQFGSEGKGKVALLFAEMQDCSVAVRVGGPNSGHTIISENGLPTIFRHLPTAAILPNTLCVIPSGAYVDVDTLFKEISGIKLHPERLLIDKNAVVLTDKHKEIEMQLNEQKGALKDVEYFIRRVQ